MGQVTNLPITSCNLAGAILGAGDVGLVAGVGLSADVGLMAGVVAGVGDVLGRGVVLSHPGRAAVRKLSHQISHRGKENSTSTNIFSKLNESFHEANSYLPTKSNWPADSFMLLLSV